MIEVENGKNRNLKNVKQVGTPKEENRIYIENMVYGQIKGQGYREKSLFVLMGHTESMEGRYATFVEAAIPVKEIEFTGMIPKWTNGAWSAVFREIKRQYEDMIIVGWALDVKGMQPKLTPDLERVHREHFGGVHQLLFLLDTLEQEECFYIYKENKLVSKDGFYIYYKAHRKAYQNLARDMEKDKQDVQKDLRVNVELQTPELQHTRGGRYRQLMREERKTKKDGSNLGIAVAVAMLIFVIGVGVYENSNTLFGKSNSLETNLLQNNNSTEFDEKDTETSEDVIDIEVVPGSE